MVATIFFGFHADVRDYKKLESIYKEPRVFTEEEWSGGESFVDPNCKVVKFLQHSEDRMAVSCAETIHSVGHVPLGFDPGFLKKSTNDNRPVRRLQIWCKMCEITFRWPGWWLINGDKSG